MKGQSSLEFLAMVSFSMLILASLYTVMADKQRDAVDFQQRETVNFVAEKVAFELEMALVQREGYSRVFSLPGSIAGDSYTVNITRGDPVNSNISIGRVRINYGENTVSRLTRYQGRETGLTVDQRANVFRVKHNSSGVWLVEQ
jgi:hypothetical protein